MSPADDQATGTGAAIGPQLQKLGKKSEWRLYLDASEPRSLHVRDPEPVGPLAELKSPAYSENIDDMTRVEGFYKPFIDR
ncbi:hypothetical protein FOBRF1_005101 [Fusarium oxysporum]